MRWFVLALLFLSAPALAQEIDVRSGAHADFARLVLYVPAGTQWTLDQNSGSARLVLKGHEGGFDSSEVFNRIDRTFIANVSADNTTLTVEFSCECSARAFAQGPRMIVLDVSKATKFTPTPSQDFALSFVGQRPLRFTESEIPAAPRQRTIDQTRETEPQNETENAVLPSNFEAFATGSDQAKPDTEGLRNAQQKLSRQISGAATRGILTPAGGRLSLVTALPKPQIDTRIFDTPATTQRPESASQTRNGNIRITSSSDIPRVGQDQVQTSTSLGIPCIDPALIAVQDWGADIGLVGRLAQLRSQLYGEFDRLDRGAALALAKTYLHYGFGAEAKKILQLDASLAQTYPALSAIAEIMEYGYSRDTHFLGNFVDCDNQAALWAILSLPEIDPARTINIKAALLSLSGLPMHLRRFIAPELSRRLLAYGDEAGAAAALRSLERAPEPLSSNANLAKADIEIAQGDVAQAQDRLSEIVASNAEQSAEALIKFIDSHLEEDAEIDEDVATLVEAYAMEMRDDPIGDELRRAHVLALGKSGQFSAAFEALSRVRARATDITEDPLRSSVLDLMSRSASDVEFLDHSFDQMAIAPETILPKTRFRIAKRLTELGFFEQAEIILAAGTGEPKTSQSALLRAEISIALQRPQEALAHLFGENSEAASVLRAEAEIRAGDYSEAHSIYSDIGDGPNSQRAAWLSDEWSLLVEEAAPVFGPVVRVAQTTLDNPPETDGMLERAKTAVSESEGAREAIRQLLNFNDSSIVDN